MSKKEKLIEAIKNNPKNVRFEDLKKILENIGYTAINNGGSHYVFTKEGSVSLTIPYKKPVKVVYVKQVIKIIDDEKVEE
ncbi:MAG TPA: type II toxin-antitoxin system HicA family toxin [Flavobacteriaceae bacterium]|nr:type II toxin-antitoxin system HicA family toxin [Flavobacteriaceae bacterium]